MAWGRPGHRPGVRRLGLAWRTPAGWVASPRACLPRANGAVRWAS
jgi:hypothetical protein